MNMQGRFKRRGRIIYSVGVGRYKKMALNNEPVYSVLTVGDQLLWGAAEPLRRMLNILLNRI
ncbi:hypothetical protein CIW66_10015 [Enterobacter cloacae]|nr:hypothetical protein CIW67_07495 [Enterobacter cloacae]PAN86348.1 hypothetical protein CIW66_10015 [Enterobacter cloacae]PAN95489.1 hypothetical protein CIW63_16020 [Enterobacter cloacae]